MSKKSALVVIDVQVNVVKDAYNRDRVLDNIRMLLARARASGTPVMYVQHESRWCRNTPATPFTRPLSSKSWRSVGSNISLW
jgi:nicotinamidase-related amidase